MTAQPLLFEPWIQKTAEEAVLKVFIFNWTLEKRGFAPDIFPNPYLLVWNILYCVVETKKKVISYPGLVTEVQRVEGTHSKHLTIRCPGQGGDWVVVGRRGKEQPAKAVPHLFWWDVFSLVKKGKDATRPEDISKISPPYIYSLLHLRGWGHSPNSSRSSSQNHRGLSTEAGGQRKRHIDFSQSPVRTGNTYMSSIFKWIQEACNWILILVMFHCRLISVCLTSAERFRRKSELQIPQTGTQFLGSGRYRQRTKSFRTGADTFRGKYKWPLGEETWCNSSRWPLNRKEPQQHSKSRRAEEDYSIRGGDGDYNIKLLQRRPLHLPLAARLLWLLQLQWVLRVLKKSPESIFAK